MKVKSIDPKKKRIIFEAERHVGDEKSYQKFLRKRGLFDINGETFYMELKPENT